MESRVEGASHQSRTPVEEIESEFEVILGRPERVAAACGRLRAALDQEPSELRLRSLTRLIPLLRRQSGAIVAPVFALLEEAAEAGTVPLTLVEGLLAARDPALQQRALALVERLTGTGNLTVDTRSASCLAGQIETEESRLRNPESLGRVAAILRRPGLISPEGTDPILSLYLSAQSERLRRLAARLLDLDGRPPDSGIAAQLLGAETYSFLRKYIEFTGAGYFDLLHLVLNPDMLEGFAASVRRAEAVCGEALLKEVIAAFGWRSLNLGIEARTYVGLSMGETFPLMLSPAESSLLEAQGGTQRSAAVHLFVSHGGLPVSRSDPRPSEDPVNRFRAYNLAHAEVLTDILDVAPLTREKVERILRTMDRLVDDFVTLFRLYSDECSILPGIYRDLRERIDRELIRESPGPQLSPELTRLVGMFEDPASLGGVRTLHGLKRYLHQQGLRLGMRLVGTGHGTNRTVDLLVASRRGEAQALRRIAYVDFEPEDTDSFVRSHIPYPVAALVEGFARQMLVGEQRLPDVKVFCYGNEVHYYLAFANHPAFLRVNYAPPLQGGMIDLEYYGVSKYELAQHPDLSLDAIALFFRRLEFDVSVENTRVHARYDKERALDLGEICAKAESLFRLAPFLMDLDWTIGALDLPREARRMTAEAWADFFANWGSLPVNRFLSSDRKGILEGVEIGAEGEQEAVWSGAAPYRDRFRTSLEPASISGLRASLKRLGLEPDPIFEEDSHAPTGQVRLEQLALLPLREAVRNGEILETPDGFQRQSPLLFQRNHEAVIFAEILGSGDSGVLAASRLALLVEPLQRALRFRTTGTVNGHAAQRASVPLVGGRIVLYVLRDAEGIIRQAFYSWDSCLCRRRNRENEPWRHNHSCDAAELAAVLRRAGYFTGREPAGLGQPVENPGSVRERLALGHHTSRSAPLPGERRVAGIGASPGRAVGGALLGTRGRKPEDFDGAVLVAPFLRPDDTAFLYHAAGIVSTGGGILSHAGLIANQFQKPAIIIPGRWVWPEKDSPFLVYRSLEYREQESEVCGMRVSIMCDTREREHQLRDGDIVVLDADEGTLCVLGQEQATLAFHEESRLLGIAAARLGQAREEREILRLRGQRLRARHQLGKILDRLADPVLACHAADEILRGEAFASVDTAVDRAFLLQILLLNSRIGRIAADYLGRMLSELHQRWGELCDKALRSIPSSRSICEVILLRLEGLRLRKTLDEASRWIGSFGSVTIPRSPAEAASLDATARQRLERLCEEYTQALHTATAATVVPDAACRHQLCTVERLHQLLRSPAEEQESYRALGRRLAILDQRSLQAHANCSVIFPGEWGHGLAPLTGWKAANLAEVALLGSGARVPPWFVVTHHAFNMMLDVIVDSPAGTVKSGVPLRRPLRDAIDSVISHPGLDHHQKSIQVGALWDNAKIPDGLADTIRQACRTLLEPSDCGSSRSLGDSPTYVAIRSSTREEDAEIAARAGEFETFLFIRDEGRILDYLKRAWSGLWTARAIHNRSVLAVDPARIGGGVVVQKIVWSRVSGVLQTSNLAGHEPREMVINVALGLGEGVVSGTVSADHVVVMKEGDLEKDPLRFRYVTADKRDRVVFNKRAGIGTIHAETLYHQRLRPALEYVELCELVSVAARLESAYGYPLDIEFGIEGTQLWILQVRPVTAFLAAYEETLERYPLAGGEWMESQVDSCKETPP
jgi:phosphohistidine swiveling domain-containing protein